jgi:hypothetical protein
MASFDDFIKEEKCYICNAKLKEPYKDGHRCPNGCDCKDIEGSFTKGSYVIFFSYRKRIIKRVELGGKTVFVNKPLFDELFEKLKYKCGQERKKKIGPFWGPDGPCYEKPI